MMSHASKLWAGGWIYAAVALLPRVGMAVEPPRVDVETAMGRGQAAFMAKAVKIELVTLNDHEAEAKMLLEVDRCYYSCPKGRLVMKYMSQSFLDTVMPVDFTVGQEILFVLQKRPIAKQAYLFDSDLKGGTDFAFVGGKLPEYHLDTDAGGFESVFTKAVNKVTYQRLTEIAAHRKQELAK